MHHFFQFSDEVEEAVKLKRPLLALESTVFTHGLPYPQNLQLAKDLCNIVKQQGVTPVIIAIMQGKIKIGLTEAELKTLVTDKDVSKASCRDIPYLLSEYKNAGTTVAATLFCAEYAGIRVFATGGIGGVHRGNALDISADLFQLAKTPIAVVCAGAKAILDLPRTLEFLETFSVPIIGYQTDCLPAFYSSSSNYKLPFRIDNIDELANILKIHWQLGMPSGVLITNPIAPQDEIPAAHINAVIENALQIADKENVSGKAVTPFVLKEVAMATQGKSVEANIKLIKNNALVASQLALKIH